MAAIEKLLEPLAGELSKEFVEVQVNKVFKDLTPEDIEEIGAGEIEKKKKELKEIMGPGMGKSMVSSTKKLASKLVLLTTGAIDFAVRLATVPLAIIGMGTTGPTISINLILPLIKQLQGEARNLSSVYDDVKSSLEALQIKELSEGNTVISGIYTTIQAEMKIVKGMVLLVGVQCDGEEGQDTSEYEKSPMPVEAKDCDNYRADEEHPTNQFPKDSIWCTKFEHVMTKTLEDFQDDDSGTAAEKYEAWRKDNAKVLADFKDDPELGTAEEQYLSWLRENKACKNCKNYKK